MAKLNFTRLFSCPELHYAHMKITIVVLFLCLIGCGGTVQPTAKPQPQPLSTPVSIASADVFSNIVETWEFQDGFGNLLWIDVQPVDSTHTIWHYHKNATQAYWAPGVAQAELFFFLEKDASGAWYSTGGHILMPQGCPWCTPNPTANVDYTYTESTVPGHPRPYLIIGDSGTIDDTIAFFGPAGSWTSKMYVQTVAMETFLISEQWEGVCGHEKWWFKPGKGLWKIEPLDQGACVDVDPKLNLIRIN